MHQVEVHVVELQGPQGLVKAGRDVLWGMMGKPQLQTHTRTHTHTQNWDLKGLWLEEGSVGGVTQMECTGSFIGCFRSLVAPAPGSHLAGDKHVLSPDDALLDLGAQGPADVHLVVVVVGRVDVAVARRDARLHSRLSLGRGARQVGWLGGTRWRTGQGTWGRERRQIIVTVTVSAFKKA